MAIRVIEALGAVLALAGMVLLLLTPRRRRHGSAEHERSQPDRRAFLNRVMIGSLGIFALALAGSSIGVLWPMRRRGFGSKIVAGKVDDLQREIELSDAPVYDPIGRFYLVKYESHDPNNPYVRAGVVAGGLMALYQKCSHLGCRVPFCPSSRYFECPCHDARFNLAGEVKNKPARAGLWRFAITVADNGDVVVDTSTPIAQPHEGVDTIDQQPAGEFCVP